MNYYLRKKIYYRRIINKFLNNKNTKKYNSNIELPYSLCTIAINSIESIVLLEENNYKYNNLKFLNIINFILNLNNGRFNRKLISILTF